MLSIKTMK